MPRWLFMVTVLVAAVKPSLFLSADRSPHDSQSASQQESGRVLDSPRPTQSGRLRILVYHDMEGLSGQNDWHTFDFDFPEQYAKGRELLVADVNAVVGGLFAGGATDVHVVDAHGSGNPEPDIPAGRLDPRAEQVFRDKPFGPYVDLVEPDAYDAVAAVGMHAKTGSRGFASHTFTLGMDIIMNTMSITETELIGYSWGRVGVPVIFASGDDRLANDLATMPWIEFVTVKKATSASTAQLRPVGEVHRELSERSARALRNRANAKVMSLTTPVKAALRVVPPASLTPLEGVPGVEHSENRVDFSAPDFGAAYDGVLALIRVAARSYPDVLTETIRARPDSKDLMGQFNEALTMRWLDYESGRWIPPAPAPAVAGVRYHGAR